MWRYLHISIPQRPCNVTRHSPEQNRKECDSCSAALGVHLCSGYQQLEEAHCNPPCELPSKICKALVSTVVVDGGGHVERAQSIQRRSFSRMGFVGKPDDATKFTLPGSVAVTHAQNTRAIACFTQCTEGLPTTLIHPPQHVSCAICVAQYHVQCMFEHAQPRLHFSTCFYRDGVLLCKQLLCCLNGWRTHTGGDHLHTSMQLRLCYCFC